MAADVTACSLPNRPENMNIARHLAGLDFFPDDDVWREDGEVFAVSHGDSFDALQTHVHGRLEFEWFEIGPLSYLKAGLLQSDYWLPGPTIGAHRVLAAPKIMTPALRAAVMVAMNVPDRSHYRDWHRGPNTPPGRRRDRRTRPGWYTRPTRKPKRQQVKGWLDSQQGRIVWAETW